MRRSFVLLLVIAGAVLALDQWTKHLANENLQYRPPIELVGEFVRLTYTRNSGVAFGLGAGVKFPYYLFSIAAALIIVGMFLRRPRQSRGREVALALILGGALGNLVDRLRSGEVVDFIEVGWSRWHWPVFNVADSAVTIGVVLFAISWHRVSAAAPAAGAPPPAIADPEAPGGTHDDAMARSLGPGATERGTVGPLPGRGADGPLA